MNKIFYEDAYKQLLIVADRQNKKLYVTTQMLRNRYKLSSSESIMFFDFKRKYPNFEIIEISTPQPIPIH